MPLLRSLGPPVYHTAYESPGRDGQDMKDGHSQRLYPAAPLRTASVPAELPAPRPTGTLLPGPIARAVSFATRSTSLALRVGTAIGAYGLGAAKVTTLSSLELGRGILDGILSRAGRDVYLGSRSEVARADAESVLASNLEALHHTMTRVVFWTSAGFHAAGTTVSTASEISLLFLSVLDQFFGSTDSSKAIASIITLIRREFQNPATGVEGEKVGVVDLILGLCGLAYLQKRCRKMIQEEHRSLGYEEIIWDVVVLKDGERIDTVQEGVRTSNPTRRSFECDSSAYDGLDDDYPEAQLRQQMIKMLPEDAEVSVSTSTTMTKIITVDIRNAPIMPIPSFPGLSIVQSEISEPQPSTPASQGQPSSYRVVYNVSRNKVEKIPATDKTVEPVERVVEEVGGESNLQPPPTPSTLSKVRDKGSLPSTSPVSPSSTEKRSPKGSSLPSTEWHAKEHGANQKRARKPLDEPQTPDKSPCVGTLSSNTEPRGHKLCMKTSGPATKAVEKGTGVSKASRKNSLPSYTNLLNRDSSSDTGSSSKKKSKPKPPWGSHKPAPGRSPRTAARGFNSERTAAALTSNREAPATPQPARLGDPNYFSSTDLGSLGIPSEGGRLCPPKPMSPANDGRRSSVVSLTDTLSVHSFGTPTSPTVRRTEASGGDATGMPSAKRGHRRASSQTASLRPPSIYSLGTRGSQASLLLSSVHAKSAYSDSEALDSLRRSGEVRGMFPEFHLLRNITRYSRFASAVYGHNFLKLMGILKDRPVPNIADEIHHEVRSFAHHVKLPPDSILLASFVDPQGGSDSTGATDTGIPLVHTIALDEESKAVVLTCRGTLGFEDVLADMMCEYDDLVWRGKEYKVHKGIHASARRLLYGGDGRVLITIRAALEQYPDYGLVLCGHSLGGAVTALLGAMLAEPSTSGTGFVISAAEHRRLLNDPGSPEVPTHICLPSGRPIHVYAYGPPATMSPSLQKVTKGLITSVVHGNDMVPYLSLGVLHDFQALALAFKSDNSEAKAEVKRRVWEGLCSGLAEKWYNNATKQKDEDDDNWVYVALKTLRVSMMSSKLLPPGEVFSVETKAVMRRDAFTQPSLDNVGKPATRIILKYIRDVEAYFREVRFGSSMLTDHSPGRYENALRRLALGAIEA